MEPWSHGADGEEATVELRELSYSVGMKFEAASDQTLALLEGVHWPGMEEGRGSGEKRDLWQDEWKSDVGDACDATISHSHHCGGRARRACLAVECTRLLLAAASMAAMQQQQTTFDD